MDFALPDDLKPLQQTARTFAREVMRPQVGSLRRDEPVSQGHHRAGERAGPDEHDDPRGHGRLELPHLAQAVIAEELAWGCAGMATSMIANDLALLPIVLAGTAEQKERFLRPFTEGFKLASFGLTEPGAGSDVAGLRCTARREGDVYVVNGQKQWITNGEYADQYSLFCTSDPSQASTRG